MLINPATGPALQGPRDSTRFRRISVSQVGFAGVILLFLIYAAIFIYRTSFVVDGQRYFSLFDDAMVSMQYARNLANGYGLVWNAGGARVEGFTNPLWVVLMSLVHLLPIGASKTSLVVQIVAAGFLAANLYFVRRISLAISGGSEIVSLGAVVLTATYLPLNFWGLEGMEVSALALIVSIALCQALLSLAERKFPIFLYLVLGASIWIRPDMVVPFVAIMLFLAVADAPNRRRHLLWGGLTLGGFCAAQTLFRIWYFGDPLPNTYYLKLAGYPLFLRMTRGVEVLVNFAWQSNILLFAVPFALAIRRDLRVLLLLWVFIAQLLYSAYVGGDAWEFWGGSNRYISIAMPAFFVLLACGLLQVSHYMVEALASMWGSVGRKSPAALRGACFFLLIAISILSFNCIHGSGALAELFLIKPPLHSGQDGENNSDVREALALRELTTPQASFLVARAGTIPYFSGRVGVDLLGKNDIYIAHQPMRRERGGIHALFEFRPGHMKYDYHYSVETLRPDLVVQLWQHQEEVRPYLAENYTGVLVDGHCVYFRRNSGNVLWEKLPPDRCD